RPELLHRGADPGDHDPADRQRDHARGGRHRAGGAEGGRARARRDALGGDPDGGPPLRPAGHRRRGDARPRQGDRRDDRGDDRDRERAHDRQGPVRPGLHARGGDRQRVRRGGVRPAPSLGADRGRPGAVPADPARERRGETARAERRAPSMSLLSTTSARRRRSDRLARASLAAATALALVPLALILYYLVKEGIGAVSLHLFTSDPTGKFFGDPGGIKSAVLGTLE